MRVSPNNPVRRCLFPADNNDESRTDNFANAFKESLEEELKEKTKKYNYDFKNDRPLEGCYMWFEGDGRYDLIGVRKVEDSVQEMRSPQTVGITESEDAELGEREDSPSQLQKENEATPKTKEDDSVPSVRKRKNYEDGAVSQNVTGVKRRLYD